MLGSSPDNVAGRHAGGLASHLEVMNAPLPNTLLKTAATLLGVLLLALGLAACGGSSQPSGSSLVNDTFSSKAKIESGQVNMSLALEPTGGSSSQSLKLSLAGPFQNGPVGKIPRFAFTVNVNIGAQPIQAGITSTDSKFYVGLGSNWYVAPSSTYKTFEQSFAQAAKQAAGKPERSMLVGLGVEPNKWLVEPSTLGTTAVNGESVYHVTAGVDTAAFLRDVSKLSQSSGSLSAAVPGASAISPSTVSELGKSISSAHVDLYTGKTDHLLRRLTITATFKATPQTQTLLNGASSAKITLDLGISQLNQPQTISAPSHPRPFSQLLPAISQLFGALQSSTAGSSSLGG